MSSDQTPVAWSLAIHGGAGTIERGALDADTEAQYRAGLERALDSGRTVLAAGGQALDAVQASVMALEDEPLFNAGRGAVFTHDGRIELDAAMMDGRDRACGAVIGVTGTRNPIALARRVMSDTPHVVLQGSGADAFARSIGMDQVGRDYFFTERRWAQLEEARQAGRVRMDHDAGIPASPSLGTVGAVARDVHGNLAAATSTGGMTNKMWGRVGDSPLIGAGTYACNRSCAISATGHGEFFIRATAARDIAAMMEYGGLDLARAAHRKVMLELREMGGEGGIIGVDAHGEIALVFNSAGMYRGQVTANRPASTAIYAD